MIPRLFYPSNLYRLIFLVGFALFGLVCAARQGKMEGILSSKGDSWIEVLNDANQLHRFIPQWHGKGPANGGHFNQETLQLINEIVVGNRVEVEWFYDGFLRMVDAEILHPNKRQGEFVGYIVNMSNRWVDIQNIDEGKPWRFYLPWVGGLPHQGGGYDQKVLDEFKKHEPTDPIRFSWAYYDRPTVVSVFENLTDLTLPFWVGKKIQPRRIPSKRSALAPDTGKNEKLSSDGSPFEQAGESPFEQAGGSPFEQAGGSPFEQAGGSPFEQAGGSPFEQAGGGPFEQAGGSPFEQAGGGPFEQAGGGGESMSNPFENPEAKVQEGVTPGSKAVENSTNQKRNPFDLSED